MQPLAQPFETLQSTYDAVIVGSGYGAGISASRMARMGLKVCVLERGRELLPGQFPSTLKQGTGELRVDTSFGCVGPDLGLFDLRVNRDISVMVGCGLGGTSLINCSVMMKPEPRVFKDTAWPKQFRAETATALATGYERAEHMLRPVTWHGAKAPKKLQAFQAAAEALGKPVDLPSLAITFGANPDGNRRGVRQAACIQCGNCVSGCNVGAKNTVSTTYLPDARNHGASIFTRIRVDHVEPHGDKWRVICSHTDENGKTTSCTVVAATVVLGAGSLGSTEILLRSAANGLDASPRLGENFSGNGDVIGFGYNGEHPVNAVGTKCLAPGPNGAVGPAVSGIIDLRTAGPLEDNVIIQDGVVPGLYAPILPALLAGGSAFVGRKAPTGSFLVRTRRALESLLKGSYRGAVRNTMTFLVMSHDGGGGVMTLERDRVRLTWPDAGKKPVFERINTLLRKATSASHGTYVKNPMWSGLLGRNLISAHPLGGCGMGDTPDRGATDHASRVFRPDGGVHEGLYVIDGAVMPRSLGVNPALTISAIAERAMMHFARDNALSFDDRALVLDGEGPALDDRVPVFDDEARALEDQVLAFDDGRG